METSCDNQQLNVKYLNDFLGSFTDATGLHTEAVTPEGETFFAPQGQTRCEFCNIVRKSPGGTQKCQDSYKRAALEAAKWEEPYFFRCHAGLVIWAIPIIIRGMAVGAIICGQVLLWEPDEFFWEELAIFNARIGDFEKLKEAAGKLEVVSPERTQSAADLLFIVVNHVVKRNVRILDELEDAKKMQQQIRNKIEERKKSQESWQYNYEAYLKKERRLLRYIRIGDRNRAEETLASLLADLFARARGEKLQVKVRIQELISLVSRAAVEGGVDAERAMQVLEQHHEELNRLEKIEEMFYQAQKITDKFLNDIFALTDRKHLSMLKKAREFITRNYNKPIKLEDIAVHLYISPSHLSRLFRQELDCTVLEYLTRVRIEEAVELMKKRQYSIEEVAKTVGFKNQSYFSKVFKKYLGVAPLVYRNSLF